MTKLQKHICHTDEIAWHKHATSSKTDLLKHREPKTEQYRSEYYMYTNSATCLRIVFVNFLNHNINAFEKDPMKILKYMLLLRISFLYVGERQDLT